MREKKSKIASNNNLNIFFRSDTPSSTVQNINVGKTSATIHTKVSKNNSFSNFPTPITELKLKFHWSHKMKQKKRNKNEKRTHTHLYRENCLLFEHNLFIQFIDVVLINVNGKYIHKMMTITT